MSIALRSALYLSMSDLAEAQTVAYGGGWTSLAPTLTETCRVQSIDLGLSIAAFDGRNAVGITLVGRRADRGWLHDIAVAAPYRRAGVGSRMMGAVLDEMRQGGVREVELDVAAMRGDAIGLYGRLGFKRTRTYLNLAATASELEIDRTTLSPGRAVVAGTESELIDAYARCQETEPIPCWDRSLTSLLAYPDGYTSRLMEGDREIGLMHYLARAASGADPERLRPLFIRMAPGATIADFRQLLAATGSAAFGQARGLTLRVALEPEQSSLARWFREINLPVVAESYDMRLKL